MFPLAKIFNMIQGLVGMEAGAAIRLNLGRENRSPFPDDYGGGKTGRVENIPKTFVGLEEQHEPPDRCACSRVRSPNRQGSIGGKGSAQQSNTALRINSANKSADTFELQPWQVQESVPSGKYADRITASRRPIR
jgi:hypothetical protein